MITAVLFSLALAAAEPGPSPLPPPPPPVATTPTPAAAPADATPPPIATPPLTPENAPPTGAPLPKPDVDDKLHTGMGSGAIVALGTLAACGANVACGIAGGAVTLVTLGLCPIGLLQPCVAPILSGYAVAFTGDSFGQQRGTAVWPVVVGYAGQLLAVGGAVATFFIAGIAFPALAGNGGASFALLGALFGPLLVYGVISLATMVAQPIVYNITAEPKHAGDDGSGYPGFLEPNHPPPPKPPKPLPAAGPPATHVVMRY